jgi:putative SbcD/Mre11-related phosphoesterase
MSEFKFVTGEPALVIGDRLVIADLHIGIDYEYWKSGVKILPYMEKMLPEVEKLVRDNRAKRLTILGDVKHMIPNASWQEIKEVPAFFRYFRKLADIEITPGNHDGLIKNHVLEGVKIHPRSGFLDGDFYFSHGHTWPEKDFLRAKYIVIGHIHPGIEFRSRLGYRWVESVWLRAELDPEKVRKKYGPVTTLPEVIVVPKFNYYTGAIAMNKPLSEVEKHYSDSPGPVMKMMKLREAKAYLLDGTYLGEVGNL